MGVSLLQRIQAAPEHKKAMLLDMVREDPLIGEALGSWPAKARPEQIPPPDGEWDTFLFVAGRAAGKTRSAAEEIVRCAKTGHYPRIALGAVTYADAMNVMIEGESGILACSDPRFVPVWNGLRGTLTWPNGTVATVYTAEKPKKLRGPQHHLAWVDEPCAMQYIDEFWDMLLMGMRLQPTDGTRPRIIATTTPKPIRWLKSTMAEPGTIIRTGTTYDNQANLAPSYIKKMLAKYEGTTIGLQELYAQILEDVAGALWSRALIDENRIHIDRDEGDKWLRQFSRIIVAIDPQAKKDLNEKRRQFVSETGIVVAAIDEDGTGYVLADVTMNGSPKEWATAAIEAFHKYKADRIVYEANQGGDMVAEVLRAVDPSIPLEDVHATRGKYTRAEPIAALTEQGRIKFAGTFGDLETQLTTYTGKDGENSPDRLDAFVWSMTKLFERYQMPSDIEFNISAGADPFSF